jgi:perosamine synthetase
MIPVNEPLLTKDDFKLLEDAFNTGWISSAGKYVNEFENEWAKYCGCKYGISVSNGTTALQVAVESIGVTPDDEVIMPSYTIISCAMAIIRAGATPVLVDSDPNTWCIDVEKIESKITKKTKAIMVVHIFGHSVDMDPVLKLAEKYDLKIIEDAAEVHGAEYLSQRDSKNKKWIKCGGIGHVSTFSFFANKLITTGEGGMVVTSDKQIAENAKNLRNLCFRTDRRFKHTELGHQFRFTNMQAAVGINQIKRMDKIIEKKRWAAKEYFERLKDIDLIQLPIEKSWAKHVHWVHSILLKEFSHIDAYELADRLKKKGVETRPFFLGMHDQPVFNDMGLFLNEKYPVSDYIAKNGLYLPSGLALTIEQIEFSSNALREALSEQ